MIKVVIRHVAWEEGVEIGEFPPSEIKSLVKLVEEFGIFTEEGNEDLLDYSYESSRLDIDQQFFEIVVS
ncbi:hypothetical protein [Cytobacillus solani]|uniref:Uncharacterized protein n=1 Tax=Cytobacillus solani TaxID=1637975 RepID=A0A0Q3VIY6_9BACI|nr:hypothetical protein [Cytobacillus solani]KOP84123.1 hypothetical protein AMS60_00310 [Bacillus sp. FJAT-21945]KQL20986.1 hypothetical protein AN957_21980 [Cytobacillus solani]